MTPIGKIKRPVRRNHWGGWQLVRSNYTLIHVDPPYYEIDLDRIHNSAGMLDIIFQVTSKQWMTLEDRAELIEAFREIFDPQAHLCSWGESMEIDPIEFLREKYEGQ